LAVVDYVIVGFIALSAVIGLVRGFVREMLALAIWAIAVMFAIGFSDQVAVQLPKAIEGESARFIAAFALVFVGTLIAGAVAQWLVMRLIATTGLSGTDRLLGVLFGGLRGAVVCIFAVIALRPFASDQPWWHASRAVPVLSSFESELMRTAAAAGDIVSRLREKR